MLVELGAHLHVVCQGAVGSVGHLDARAGGVVLIEEQDLDGLLTAFALYQGVELGIDEAALGIAAVELLEEARLEHLNHLVVEARAPHGGLLNEPVALGGNAHLELPFAQRRQLDAAELDDELGEGALELLRLALACRVKRGDVAVAVDVEERVVQRDNRAALRAGVDENLARCQLGGTLGVAGRLDALPHVHLVGRAARGAHHGVLHDLGLDDFAL